MSKTAVENSRTKADKLREMATEAKLAGDFLEVSEIRFAVCGIPAEITDEYIYFDTGFEVEHTGNIQGPPTVEKMYKSHAIAMQAVTAWRICMKPKEAK